MYYCANLPAGQVDNAVYNLPPQVTLSHTLSLLRIELILAPITAIKNVYFEAYQSQFIQQKVMLCNVMSN